MGLGSNGCDSEEAKICSGPDGPFGGGGDVFNLTLEGFKSDEGLDLSVQELEGYDADEGQFIFNRAISFEQGYYARTESGKEITFSCGLGLTMAREFDESLTRMVKPEREPKSDPWAFGLTILGNGMTSALRL